MQSGRHANHYLLKEKLKRKARLSVNRYLHLYGCQPRQDTRYTYPFARPQGTPQLNLFCVKEAYSLWNHSTILSVLGSSERQGTEPHNSFKVKLLNCVTLCDPMDCSLPGSTSPWDFPGKNTGVGCHFLSPGDLPNPGIESRSPTLQGKADTLPSELPGKPREPNRAEFKSRPQLEDLGQIMS